MNISFDDACNHGIPKCEGTHGFVALVDGKVAGDFDIRTNQSSIDAIGHIGYEVKKEFRGRGIGTKLCEEALRQARTKFGISDVIICCASDNIHSRRIIEKCGGRFLSEKKCCTGAHMLLRFVISA